MSWISNELISVNLGDKRLEKRMGRLLDGLCSKPQESLPACFTGWSDTIAAYRFLDNEKVTPEKLLRPHTDATLERIKSEDIILNIQDTSEFNFSHCSEVSGLGLLSRTGEQGFHLHPTLAMTPERIFLGILQSKYWVRERLGESCKRASKPIEEKESYRWLQSYRASCDLANKFPEKLVVNISDREGDIYDIFAESNDMTEGKAHWLVRAHHNRYLDDSTDRLKDKVQSLDKVGSIEFELSSRKNRPARRVKQTIRAGSVVLKPPKKDSNKFSSVAVNVVYCKEESPPEGVDAIEWILLTSVPLSTKERALDIIQWYLCRWEIEIFFKVLKTGCEIEELQLKAFSRIINCLTLYMIVGWRIMYTMMLGRSCPEVSCEVAFSKEEWQSVYAVTHKSAPPAEAPNLAEIIKMIGKLGGHLGRKSDGVPGPKAMWEGFRRMKDFVIAWEIMPGMVI